MADQTIVNYELIEKYGKEFEDQADLVAEAISALRLKAQGLESFWIGQGAEKFFDEFYQEVLPATIRLQAAFLLGAEVLRKIINLFETSDQECAGYFSESALESGMAASGASDLHAESAGEGGGGGAVSDLHAGSTGGGGGGGGTTDQSKGMEGNLRMGVSASGQGTTSPGSGGASDSGGMADHIYDTGSGSGSQATPDSTPAATGGEATDQADTSNLPKAAGGIAGAAAAGAAAKKKKDKNDTQD